MRLTWMMLSWLNPPPLIKMNWLCSWCNKSPKWGSKCKGCEICPIQFRPSTPQETEDLHSTFLPRMRNRFRIFSLILLKILQPLTQLSPIPVTPLRCVKHHIILKTLTFKSSISLKTKIQTMLKPPPIFKTKIRTMLKPSPIFKTKMLILKIFPKLSKYPESLHCSNHTSKDYFPNPNFKWTLCRLFRAWSL